MQKIIECVPNFSEGRDMNVIRQITDQIETVEGVKLLNVDPGKATNRTVVTFVGTPGAVVEAAFRGIKKAGELIDMSKHKGEHPRMGATDVCPLIPISGITMAETAAYAKKLEEWCPDCGPAEFDAKRGATVIGARDFLVAFNVNLNTTPTRRANSIAFD